jgi:hypothetical protein
MRCMSRTSLTHTWRRSHSFNERVKVFMSRMAVNILTAHANMFVFWACLAYELLVRDRQTDETRLMPLNRLGT